MQFPLFTIVHNLLWKRTHTHTHRPGAALLKYFETSDDPETSSSSGTGFMILSTIHVLSKGSEALVMAMMSSSVCSALVGCVNFFLDLPPPAGKNECVCVSPQKRINRQLFNFNFCYDIVCNVIRVVTDYSICFCLFVVMVARFLFAALIDSHRQYEPIKVYLVQERAFESPSPFSIS